MTSSSERYEEFEIFVHHPYNKDGQFLFQFGGEKDKFGDLTRPDDEGQLDKPTGICTDSLGNIILADQGDCFGRVEMRDKTGKFLYRIFEENNLRFNPVAVAMAPQGQLVVVGYKVTVFENNMLGRVQPGRVTFGRRGKQPGQFTDPRGLVVSDEGEIFVADFRNQRVQVFTLQGTFVQQFPTVVPGEQKMNPTDVALDGEGNLWVVGKEGEDYKDSANFAVQYNKQGRVLRKIHLQETGRMRGVAVDTRRNHILITQTTEDSGEVLVFRPDGTLVRTVGQQQGMKGTDYITVDGEGNILVSYDCVYVYNEDGQFLFQFGGKGSEGQLINPCGICTDRAGNIFVASLSVKMFDKTGRFLKHIATGMEFVQAVAMGPRGQLVVTTNRPKVIVLETY